MKHKPIIQLQNCSLALPLQFQGKKLPILKAVTLDIYDGEFLVLVGPSGSGKSTLLRVLSGLEKSFTGDLVLDESITREDMSFVFQQYALYPWLSVYDNIALGLLARHEDPAIIKQKVIAAATDLGLKAFISSYPRELSGGMKQRVGIARALVTEPKVIFMDEPFSGLDSFTATELRADLLEIWEKRQVTIVLVTHLPDEAVELGDRIVVFTSRPASIEAEIKNSLARPRKKRTKPFYALQDKIIECVRP